MLGGHVDAVSRTQVAGWAADSDHPGRALELRILVDGVESGRILADQPREDITALGRYGTGGHGFAFAFPEPLKADSDHIVTVHYAATMELLPNGERMLPRDLAASTPNAALPSGAAMPAGLDPILVTAPGRSGTTYLMSCLAACPEIMAAEIMPYEVRQLAYTATVFEVLTAPADTRSTHPDRLEGDGFHIGSNPFTGPQYADAFQGHAALAQFQDGWVPAQLGTALAGIVREYYRRMAIDHGRNAVRFFAEKNNNMHEPTRRFVRRMFPAMRELAIVRDPRDVLCSHKAYFSSSLEAAFSDLRDSCRRLAALQDEGAGDLCFIRYEDMISADPATFSRLSAFLGVPVAPIGRPLADTMFLEHGTSATPKASVGRWRRELPPAMRAQAGKEWGSFLEQFGYDPT